MVVFFDRSPEQVVAHALAAGMVLSRLALMERVRGVWRMHFA